MASIEDDFPELRNVDIVDIINAFSTENAAPSSPPSPVPGPSSAPIAAFEGSTCAELLVRIEEVLGGMATDAAKKGIVLEMIDKFNSKGKRESKSKRNNSVLEEWFEKNKDNPYPSPEEKKDLAIEGNMDLKQVEHWFTNHRKRKWKKMQ